MEFVYFFVQVNLIPFSLFLRGAHGFIMGIFVCLFVCFAQGLCVGDIIFVPPRVYLMNLREKASPTISTKSLFLSLVSTDLKVAL